MTTRRDFLRLAAATSAAIGVGPTSWASDSDEDAEQQGGTSDSSLEIVSVDAFPVHMYPPPPGGWPLPKFSSDDDPARWRFLGPFAQLPSSIVVIIKTNQGITGFGHGAGGKVAAEIIRGHLRHLLVGANPLRVEQLWNQMYSSGLFYGRRGVFVMALSGVDNALWDIRGKHAGKPVYRMIGGTPKDKAEVYFTHLEIDIGLELGMKNFKLMATAGPNTPEEEIDRVVNRVLGARERIGPDARLMIDATARFQTVEFAIEMARRLEKAGLYFMEEALSPDNILGKARLVREVSSTRIASGEHEYTHHGFEMLLHHRAVEILQPDVAWSGGLTALLRISKMAEEHALAIIPHRGGSLFGLPIALTRAHCPLAEAFGVPGQGTDVVKAMSPRYSDGFYYPSEAPGFGHELTEELVREHSHTSLFRV
jgi:L-rhamnonate dehydratase